SLNITDANNNTLSIVNSVAQIDIDEIKPPKPRLNKKAKATLICPQEKQAPFQLIPTLCRRNRDCRKSGNNFRCCNLFGSKRCVQGVPKPIPEPPHDPIFGIPRRCPKQPLTETFWEIKTCQTDNDCWPRVCCPDGDKKYCRTSQPVFEESDNPAARQLAYPIESVSQYLQCTPPPPVIFDIHPKSCNSTLDCFPNLCCQESGKRHCRPPRRSLLALVTGLTSRFNIGVIKDITDNLVIKK
ncbi:AAEL014823-PA, partial [Aedes aegypti]